MYIGDAKYGPYATENMAKVVCRQLGFTQNIPQIWGGQAFFFDQSPEFYRKFECNGSEEKLEDCEVVVDYDDHPWTSAGIICNSTLQFYLEGNTAFLLEYPSLVCEHGQAGTEQ